MNSSCGVTRATLLPSHSFSYESIAAAAHIVYLGLWRFLGAALLGVMRFIERPAARARLLLAECGQAKDPGFI